jgi:exodeoxyribonuclease VII large subunit
LIEWRSSRGCDGVQRPCGTATIRQTLLGAAGRARARRSTLADVKVDALQYGDRKVYAVSAFNRGVAEWLSRLPTVWVEGEVTELRRHDRWQTVFFTLRDAHDGSCLGVTIGRGRFDALRLELVDGERVHVFGRPELFEARGDFRLRALSIERLGLGAHLAALERLKAQLAVEGLFADDRKRPLPRVPRRIGLVTGNDAAAKQDVLTTITTRFPPARVAVAETYVQGPRAAIEIVAALRRLGDEPDVDVIVLARGGGSFDDLLPFSDERVVRAVAASPVPIVSAVGHEQDTPLCDLAADVRASTPTAAGKLVVPELSQLSGELDRARASLARSVRRLLERDAQRVGHAHAALGRSVRRLLDRDAQRLELAHERLRRAPALAVERKRAALEATAGRLLALSPRATLERGYAIVRTDNGSVLLSAGDARDGARIDVELRDGSFGARVER